jgi:hypothetical protein
LSTSAAWGALFENRPQACVKGTLLAGVGDAADFHQDSEQETLTINQKVNKHRTIVFISPPLRRLPIALRD